MDLHNRIYHSVKNFGKSGNITYGEICELIDKEKVVFYREKYGFIKILTGYNLKKGLFNYIQSPLAYSFSEFQTYLNLFTFRSCETYQKSFEEIEYFAEEVRSINKFWKWYLIKFLKLV